MSIYAIPNTDNWVDTDVLTQDMVDEGYIETTGYPPILDITNKLDGKMYIANEIGEWILVDNPNAEKEMKLLAKKIFKTDKVTPSMFRKLSNKFGEIAKEK